MVLHANVLPETESRLMHCEPDVAALAPHKFWYTVNEPCVLDPQLSQVVHTARFSKLFSSTPLAKADRGVVTRMAAARRLKKDGASFMIFAVTYEKADGSHYPATLLMLYVLPHYRIWGA